MNILARVYRPAKSPLTTLRSIFVLFDPPNARTVPTILHTLDQKGAQMCTHVGATLVLSAEICGRALRLKGPARWMLAGDVDGGLNLTR